MTDAAVRSARSVEQITTILGTRFMEKVSVEDRGYKSPCWIWTAGATTAGRGRFWYQGRLVLPYRLALAVRYAVELPELDTLNGCHECDVPACCNPFHAEPKSQSENMKDCVSRGRIGGFVKNAMAAKVAAIRASRDKKELAYLDERFAVAMAAD